jgi:hypothetical protein
MGWIHSSKAETRDVHRILAGESDYLENQEKMGVSCPE